MLVRLGLVATFVCALVFASAARADEDFARWLEGVRDEALARGIAPETLMAALSGIAPIARVIELDRDQPEFTLTFGDYVVRMASPERIAEARARLADHGLLLREVGARYGVAPRFIVALWGIESNFGAHVGGFPVIAALATLAYDGRRAEDFRQELLDALAILDEKHITPESMIGSWAGAMGQSQFMPSSFLRFSVDYDGDGRRDIWQTPADVFASTANYLAQSGWNPGHTWGRPVRLAAGFDMMTAGLDAAPRPLTEWQALGVRRLDGSALPVVELDASLLLPDGAAGPAFLVYDNFHTILTWNRSQFFGLAVGLLADGIGAD